MRFVSVSAPPSPFTTGNARWFVANQGSVVLVAKAGDSPPATQALEKLGRAYWLPLCVYIRRDELGINEAQHPRCFRQVQART